MLYYEKDLVNPKEVPRAAFDQLWRFLDFREFVNYSENRAALRAWREDHRPGPPDLAASIMAHLAYKGWLDKGALVENALRYCRTMLEDAKYEETALYDIQGRLETQHNHVILAFGCQGHDVRDYRAAATFHLVKRLSTVPLKIVFSGHHPAELGSSKTVRCNDEARALEREFSRLVERDPDMQKRHNFTIAIENDSGSTRENLNNFFSREYLASQEAALFLVSSTFHLPRLARDAESLIGANDRLQDLVQRIYLVGSEARASEDKVANNQNYIKAMLYEVYEHLFTNAPLIERPGAYEGAV